MTLFAVVAFFLASVGIYGLFALWVGRREREIGIRLAMGARSEDVTRMILKRSLGVTLCGLVGGFLGIFWLAGLIRSLLYEIAPSDPFTLVVAAALVLASALIASWLPIRRLLRKDLATMVYHD